MPVLWRAEACDQLPDSETQVVSIRLTQSALHSVNVYCEQPYTSPDGRRIAVMRSVDPDPRMPPFELLVADLYSLHITSVERAVASHMVATSAWSGWIYYISSNQELLRINLTTLEKEMVWTRWPFPPEFVLESVSADLRYLAGVEFRPDFMSQIVRVDLAQKTWKTLYESAEYLTHAQFNPVPGAGNDLLVQLNRGSGLNHMWERRKIDNPLGGATHFLIDQEGGNFRPLPIGEPHTISSSGHCGWMADTGRIGVSTHWNLHDRQLDSRWPQGNFFTVAAGESGPRVFHSPQHRFNHVNVSRCGRYFVCDSYWKGVPGPIALVVGDLVSGKHRILLSDCRASGGGAAASHPHAYFTADNRHVIYNADPYWLGQVFSAIVPEGFLESMA